jgi:glycosyltransferase involved in cell wall biosynthesis
MNTEKLNDPALSVIIPLFNEAENIEPLYTGLKSVLDGFKKDCEIIFVDDGSSDRSFDVLAKITGGDPRVRAIRFKRNYGQTAALSAGFDHARGTILITMDGDMQNDPRDIPRLCEKIDAGYDIVSGWRKKRKDAWLTRRLPSKIANWIISTLTGVRLKDYGCTLKAYRRDIVRHINLYGEMHRFIPALASWAGAAVAEIEVNHHPRRRGASKYGLSRTLKVILDLITVKFLVSFSTRPIHVFGFLGMIGVLGGFVAALALIGMKIFYGTDMTGNPFLYLAVLGEIVGIQFIVLGLLGELIIRGYYETQKKAIYVIKEIREGGSRSES